MTQTHSKKFHCKYLLHFYPFDTQVLLLMIYLLFSYSTHTHQTVIQICRVDLQVKEFDKRNVELLPDKMDLMTDTELSQYFMKSWTLDFKDPGNVYKTTTCK